MSRKPATKSRRKNIRHLHLVKSYVTGVGPSIAFVRSVFPLTPAGFVARRKHRFTWQRAALFDIHAAHRTDHPSGSQKTRTPGTALAQIPPVFYHRFQRGAAKK